MLDDPERPMHDAGFTALHLRMEKRVISKPSAECIPVTIRALKDSAATAEQGLTAIFLPGDAGGLESAHAAAGQLPGQALQHKGIHEILNLTDDLMLTRMDVHHIPEEAHLQRFALQFDGWLFLHFRLDGLSREASPKGDTATLGRHSFILSASRHGQPSTREVLGDSWRTVGIVCQPSFVTRELQLRNEELPAELQRFQAGEDKVDFWYAGEMTNEMARVANALLHPSVSSGVRSIYLRAKVVELVCLAMDRLQRAQPVLGPSVRLGRHDIACLKEARTILEHSRVAPSLDGLARRVGLNRSKLAAGFKQVYGSTIAAYHRELRLEEAFQALKCRSATIGRVADEAGYSDAGSFTKAFKARYSILPSEVIADTVGIHAK